MKAIKWFLIVTSPFAGMLGLFLTMQAVALKIDKDPAYGILCPLGLLLFAFLIFAVVDYKQVTKRVEGLSPNKKNWLTWGGWAMLVIGIILTYLFH